jgi:hypothetical protein
MLFYYKNKYEKYNYRLFYYKNKYKKYNYTSPNNLLITNVPCAKITIFYLFFYFFYIIKDFN